MTRTPNDLTRHNVASPYQPSNRRDHLKAHRNKKLMYPIHKIFRPGTNQYIFNRNREAQLKELFWKKAGYPSLEDEKDLARETRQALRFVQEWMELERGRQKMSPRQVSKKSRNRVLGRKAMLSPTTTKGTSRAQSSGQRTDPKLKVTKNLPPVEEVTAEELSDAEPPRSLTIVPKHAMPYIINSPPDGVPFSFAPYVTTSSRRQAPFLQGLSPSSKYRLEAAFYRRDIVGFPQSNLRALLEDDKHDGEGTDEEVWPLHLQGKEKVIPASAMYC